jgi:hypothetical protein
MFRIVRDLGRYLAGFAVLIALGCGGGGGASTETHTVSSDWSCGGHDCQDVYDVTVQAGATVTIAVTAVTGNSVVRLAAFGPGVGLDGTNLLTGLSEDRQCVDQDASDTTSFTAATAGTYRIAVGRDYGSSAGSSGTYTLTVTVNGSLTFIGQTADDAPPSSTGMTCP